MRITGFEPGATVRVHRGKKYWFNENGILESGEADSRKDYVKRTALNICSETENGRFVLINYNLVRKAISKMEVGDTLGTLNSLLNSVKLEKHQKPTGINRFITRIERPTYERVPENKNRNTFDFIRVYANVISSFDDKISYIKKNKNQICEMVIDKIKADCRFEKYGVPINFLKLEKMTFVGSISSIEFLFCLKTE